MELWEQKFVAMFIFKKPVCQYDKTYKFLKAVHAKYHFTPFNNKEHAWMTNVLDHVSLTTDAGQLIGESYVDGSGWFKPNVYTRGRGVYSKMRIMESLIKQYALVIGESKTHPMFNNSDDMIHFRMKPQNLRFLSSTKGFSDFVTAKYATTSIPF